MGLIRLVKYKKLLGIRKGLDRHIDLMRLEQTRLALDRDNKMLLKPTTHPIAQKMLKTSLENSEKGRQLIVAKLRKQRNAKKSRKS